MNVWRQEEETYKILVGAGRLRCVGKCLTTGSWEEKF